MIITVRHFYVCLYQSVRERKLHHCQVKKQPISISHPILGRRYFNYERRSLLSSLPHPHIPWESLLAGYGPLDKKWSHENRPHIYIPSPRPQLAYDSWYSVKNDFKRLRKLLGVVYSATSGLSTSDFLLKMYPLQVYFRTISIKVHLHHDFQGRKLSL